MSMGAPHRGHEGALASLYCRQNRQT